MPKKTLARPSSKPKAHEYQISGRLTLSVDFWVTAETEDEAFRKIEDLDWDQYTTREAVDAEPRSVESVSEEE